MALSDYQFEYTNGPITVLMGPASNIDVLRVEGLFDMDIRDGDREWTRNHGDLAGEHLLAPKDILIDLEVIGDPTLTTYWDDVYEAQRVFTTRQFPSDADQLHFKVPGLPERFVRARPTRRTFPRKDDTELGAAPMSVILKAADPRIYTPIGAMISSGTQSGTFNVVNDGTANAYPRLSFTSTGADITLTNNTFPHTFTLTAPPSGTVVADMDRWIRGVNDLIIYLSTTSHYDKWAQIRRPFVLGSGTNSLTLTGATNVTVQHYHTWI